jgi:hypothetical protein
MLVESHIPGLIICVCIVKGRASIIESFNKLGVTKSKLFGSEKTRALVSAQRIYLRYGSHQVYNTLFTRYVHMTARVTAWN